MSRDVLTQAVVEALVDPVFQRTLADALSARLQHRLAGEALYIPKSTSIQRRERDDLIRQGLDAGRLPAELQNTYRVSMRTIYRIKRRKAQP